MTTRSEPLSRDLIVATALAIIDESGLDALSMRTLAGALDAKAMSLYHYVRNKDALLDAVVERVLREMTLPAVLPSDPLELVTEMFVAFRAALARHPNVLPALVTRPLNSAGGADVVEAPLAALRSAGLTASDAGALYQTLVAYTVGHALLSARAPRIAPNAPMRDRAKSYPATTTAGPAVRATDEATFRERLTAIVRGFANPA